MTKNQLREAIRAIIKKELAESTTTKPAKPGTKTPPKIGKRGIKTKPKATMTETDMVNKIVKRYKNKPIQENEDELLSNWQKGYKDGYNEGYKDAAEGKSNKFKK